MTNLIIRIHNQETDEIIDREMTAEELEQLKAVKIKAEAKVQAEVEALAAKEAARQAVLDRLGLTAEEAALLLS